MPKPKVSFPHMGHYYVVFKDLIERAGGEVVVPPPITKRTLELGGKLSPEAVCIPFKYNLGNYIEALERGADTIVQAGGGCRFGYYGEVQEEILRRAGYRFNMIKLTNNVTAKDIIDFFRHLNPKLSTWRIVKILMIAYQKAKAIDVIEARVRRMIGFEAQQGECERLFRQFLNDLGCAQMFPAISKVKKHYLKLLNDVAINKPPRPLKIGVVGELYVLMEPFANFELERELARYGVEVHRFVTLTTIIHRGLWFDKNIRHYLKLAAPYLRHHIGAHGTESVGLTHELIKRGFDGVIHIKPFGCMPEVNAMSALHKISRDYHFPIIYFSFDSQTSQTGLKTRLEAFYDMLVMKQAGQAAGKSP